MSQPKMAAAASTAAAALVLVVLSSLHLQHHYLLAGDADDAPLAQPEHVCEWGRQREESFPNVLSKPWWPFYFFLFLFVSFCTHNREL